MVSSGQLGATRRCGRRGPPACLRGSPECAGHRRRVPGGLEGENRILEAATEPPATGFGARRGVRRSGPHGEVRGILISVLGLSGPSLYGSGAGRVSISHLGRIFCSRAPRRSARHTAGSAPTKSGARRQRAILADQKSFWWAAKVTPTARRSRSGLGPQVRNLRVRNYVHLLPPIRARRARPLR